MLPQYTPLEIEYANRAKSARARMVAAASESERRRTESEKEAKERAAASQREAARKALEAKRDVLAVAIERALDIPLPPVNPKILPSIPPGPSVDVRRIIGIIAKSKGIAISDLMGRRHNPEFAGPRCTAMFCAWALLPQWSLPKMGKVFDRDHTTILFAVRKVCNQFDIPYPGGRLHGAVLARKIMADAGYIWPDEDEAIGYSAALQSDNQ